MKRKMNVLTTALFLSLLLCVVLVSTASGQWDIEIVDFLDDELWCIGLALDGAGNPHIIYSGDDYEYTPTYAWRSPAGWYTETIVKVSTQASCSIAVDQAGRPHVSFINFSNFEGTYLCYGYHDGADWHLEAIESWWPSPPTSIAIDGLGYPHIAHSNFGTGALLASKGSQGWNLELVDSSYGQVSMALDSGGSPHISIDRWGLMGGSILYAFRDSSDWHVEVAVVGDNNNVQIYSSIAVDTAGDVHIAWYDRAIYNLMYGRRTNAGWQVEVVDSDGVVGFMPSLAVDNDGHPHISYYDATNDALKYAWHDGSQWNIEVVDPLGDSGRRSSLALDDQGQPCIAYYDAAYGLALYATRDVEEIYSTDYVVARWVNGDLDPNDPCEIGLVQILQAIAWWAEDTVVPYTGGQTIDLLGILDLIAKWANDTCIEQTATPQSILHAVPLSASQSADIIEATRQIVMDSTGVEDRLAVTVTLTAKQAISGLALEENLPEGWSLIPIDNAGAAFKEEASQWLWLTVAAGETLTVRYQLELPPNATLDVLLSMTGTIRAASPLLEVEVTGYAGVPIESSVQEGTLEVVAFPNPVRDIHTVAFQARGERATDVEAMRVEIYDLAAQLVYRSEQNGASLEWHTETLSGDYLANGVYLCRIALLIDGVWKIEEIKKLTVLR